MIKYYENMLRHIHKKIFSHLPICLFLLFINIYTYMRKITKTEDHTYPNNHVLTFGKCEICIRMRAYVFVDGSAYAFMQTWLIIWINIYAYTSTLWTLQHNVCTYYSTTCMHMYSRVRYIVHYCHFCIISCAYT